MSVDDRTDFGPNTQDQQRITDAVTAIVERRAVIEQAIGMLMVIYDLSSEQSFDLLKWCSQHDNVKLRVIAQRLCSEIPGKTRGMTSQLRLACDKLLFSDRPSVDAAFPDAMC